MNTHKNRQRGHLIAYYRKLTGLTQDELGRKLGLSAKAISAWETGRNEPNMGQAYDMAKAFNIEVTELMLPPSEDDKQKEEILQLVGNYQQADAVTKEMVRRILKIDSNNEKSS